MMRCGKRRCLLLLSAVSAVASVLALLFLLLIPSVLREGTRRPAPLHPGTEDPTPHTGLLRRSDLHGWTPKTAELRTALAYLNVPSNQVADHLPLTLHGPLSLSNESLCRTTDGSDVDIVFYVHTAPSHFRRRELMRKTFLATNYFEPFKIRTAFLVGEVENASLQTALLEEHEQFGDLVQGPFLDSYRNLSHKGVMGLRWISRHCAQPRLVVKLDDDVFFDTFKLLARYWPFMRDKRRHLLCIVLRRSLLHREGKWRVDGGQFPGLGVFPYHYCKGMMVAMTGDLVPLLYAAASLTPAFVIDDVYLFGMLPSLVENVTMVDVDTCGKVMTKKPNETEICIRRERHNCPLLVTLAEDDTISTVTQLWQQTLGLYHVPEQVPCD